jgi:predicted RNA-binding protein YlqC (UPF0109 family)
MRALIEFIAGKLVDQPDQITVTQHEDEESITLELRVAQEDLGKVIGKQGRTARAMRAILAAAVTGEGKRTRLEIVE